MIWVFPMKIFYSTTSVVDMGKIEYKEGLQNAALFYLILYDLIILSGAAGLIMHKLLMGC